MRPLYTLFVLFACISRHVYADSCEATVSELRGHIVFNGCISDGSSRLLIEKLISSPSKPLVIISEGGGVDSAIKVALELVMRPRRIVFLGDCNSSCANYILPAARPATIGESASFILHGDAVMTLETRSDEVKRLPLAARRGIEELAESEKALWRKLPGAETVHQLQRIAIGSIGSKVSIRLGQRSYQCSGLGATQWRLSRAALDEIVPVWDLENGSTYGVIRSQGSTLPELPSVNPPERCTSIR